MMIQDKQQAKSKAFAVSSIMKNPKLAKLMSDAWDSPVGSTKNTKALGILKSLHKVNNNYNIQDGAGGSGLDLTGSFDSTKYNTGAPGLDFSGSLPKTPDIPQAPDPTQLNPQVDLTGTPEAQQPEIDPTKKTLFLPTIDDYMPQEGRLNKVEDPTSTSLIQDPKFSGYMPTHKIDPVTGFLVKREPWEIVGDTKTSMSTPSMIGGKNSNSIIEEGAYSPAVKPLTPTPPEPDPDQPFYGPNLETGDFNSDIPSGGLPEGSKITVDNLLGSTGPTAVDSWFNSLSEADQEKYQDTYDLAKSKMDDGAIRTWYNGLDADEKFRYADLYEAAKSGMGSEAWAMEVLGNKQMLMDLGMPAETANSFPASGLLTDQLDTLRQTVKDSYNLDNQLDMLVKMLNQNLTVKDDVSAYIRGKDEYLGQLDKMIDDTTTQFAYMDTSNPYTAQRAENYLNYLTILRGKQSGRYTDFLNLAVNSNTAHLQQAQNLYELTSSKVDEEYATRAAKTTESYNSIKTMLKEMYDNVLGQEALQRERENYQNEIVNNSLDLAYNTLRNNKYAEEIGENISYDDADLDMIKIQALGMNEDYPNEFDSYDPMVALSTSSTIKQDPNIILNTYAQAHKASVIDLVGSGEIFSTLAKYTPILDELTTNLSYFNQAKANGMEMDEGEEATLVATQAAADRMKTMLESGTSYGLKKFLEPKVKELKAAVEDLAGGGHGFFSGWFDTVEAAESRDNFINNYQEDLGDVAGLLFDYFQYVMAGSPASLKGFRDKLDENDETFLTKLTSELTNFLLTQ